MCNTVIVVNLIADDEVIDSIVTTYDCLCDSLNEYQRQNHISLDDYDIVDEQFVGNR